MKVIVRSLVIALAVTGAIASTYAAPTKAAKTGAMPVPSCAPGTGSCGMGNW